MGLISAVCLLLAGIILLCEIQIVKGSYDQQMAQRWAKEGNAAQVSIFFAEGAVENEDYFRGMEQNVEKALQNQGKGAGKIMDLVCQQNGGSNSFYETGKG